MMSHNECYIAQKQVSIQDGGMGNHIVSIQSSTTTFSFNKVSGVSKHIPFLLEDYASS